MTPSIPLNDLKRHVEPLLPKLSETLQTVLTSGWYTLGEWGRRFEVAFAQYNDVKHVVGVGNGTDALEIALRGLGCSSGDEIVTVANAGAYSTTAILHVGAKPVYIDIEPASMLMDAEHLAKVITPKTKAIIVTHLYGLMADMPKLCAIAEKHHIPIIEDCAQAHGAMLDGKKAGSWGTLGCFSFYPAKNLGALGDAGCIVTNDDNLAATLRELRQYGWREKYVQHEVLGKNSRMDEIQAAILLEMLPYLDGWNKKRQHIIQRYSSALSSLGIEFQALNLGQHVGHLCVIRIPKRDQVAQALRHAGIMTDIHYPMPDYKQNAVVKYIGSQAPLPVTEEVIKHILTIPCFPEMHDDEVERVISAVRGCCKP